jgi:hypothetical protein
MGGAFWGYAAARVSMAESAPRERSQLAPDELAPDRRHAERSLRPAFQARPIFLHGLWRSGSTFVWSRFRAAEGVTAYFEPLSPALARLTRARIHRTGWRDTMERNRHPVMERPYFAEYEPLLRGRGVRTHRRAFAAERFASRPDESEPALEAYIDALLAHARAEGRRPVLGFVRTGLRMGALRQAFGAYDVHIDRHPLAVWSSYQRHAENGTHNFFANLLYVLERNAHDPLFAPLAADHHLRRGFERAAKPRVFYREAVDRLTPEESYGLVFWFWLMGALHAASHADMILDVSLAETPGYVGELEARLKCECGLDVSLEGLTTVREPERLPFFDRRGAETRALEFLPLEVASLFFDPSRVQSRLGELAPAKAEILAQVLAKAEGNPKITGD